MSYFVACLWLGASVEPARYRTCAAARGAARTRWVGDEGVLILKARSHGRACAQLAGLPYHWW